MAGIKGHGYGMPSSHAQFVAFFCVYLTLFLLLRHSPHPSDTHTPTTFIQRMFLSVLSFLFAALVCASRIYLSYHTTNQVLVGCIAGAMTATMWFAVTAIARQSGWIEWALERRELIMLRIRDLVVEEDLAESGWERWRNVKKRRKAERVNGSVSERKQR